MNDKVITSMNWNGGKVTRDMYREMQDACVASAEVIAQKARNTVPVGAQGKRQHKHLRDTIRAVGKRKQSRTELVTAALASGQPLETAMPGAFVIAGERKMGVYWHYYVEYGTYDNVGQPFMRPAMDSSFDVVKAHAARAVDRMLLKNRRAQTAARR